MAVLSETDRVDAWKTWMVDNTAEVSLTKSQIRAAIDATDDWADTNAVSYNLALPLAARTSLTASQKARLLMLVIRLRFGVS